MKKPVLPIRSEHLPFLKLLLIYAIGVWVGYSLNWSPVSYQRISVVCAVLFTMTVLLYLMSRRKLYTLSFYIFLFGFAIWRYADFAPESKKDYVGDRQFFQLVGKVTDEPLVKEKTLRFPVQLLHGVDSQANIPISGTVMVSIRRESNQTKVPLYGDVIQFAAALRQVSPPLNPGEFDYRQYLKDRGIHFQVFLSMGEWETVGHEPGWLEYVLRARQFFVRQFRYYIPDAQAFQIASALVFGYRSEMNAETLSAFTNTGTIHVLSVSGLHVSMVFLLLTFLLKPIDRFPKGVHIRFGVILVLIWWYVILTGMAPPILRAGIMITFLVIAQWINRRQISLNTLLASAFFILVFAPEMLFDVGFQLSYLAMLGIFLLYPLLRKGYVPDRPLLRVVVEYSYISIAAQLFTAPLALYYFGQFPNYFLLANLVIAIPATLVMYAGIGLMLFPVGVVGVFLGKVEASSVWIMYRALKWIDGLPLSTFQGIPFSWMQVLLLFIGIGCLFYAFNYRQKSGLYGMVLSVGILIGSFYWEAYQISRYTGVKIYSVRQEVAIAWIRSGEVVLFSTLDSLNHPTLNYAVMPDLKKYDRTENFLLVPLGDTANIILEVDGKSILFWNQEDIPYIYGDMLFVRHNRRLSKTHLDQAGLIILDGSNYGKNMERNMTLLDSLQKDYYVLKNNFAYVWEK